MAIHNVGLFDWKVQQFGGGATYYTTPLSLKVSSLALGILVAPFTFCVGGVLVFAITGACFRKISINNGWGNPYDPSRTLFMQVYRPVHHYATLPFRYRHKVRFTGGHPHSYRQSAPTSFATNIRNGFARGFATVGSYSHRKGGPVSFSSPFAPVGGHRHSYQHSRPTSFATNIRNGFAKGFAKGFATVGGHSHRKGGPISSSGPFAPVGRR